MINNKKIICNKTFDKNEIKKLIEWFLSNYGTIRTNKLLDKLKTLGFKYTTLAGISIGIEDLNIPATRTNLFKNAENDLKKSQKLFKQGEITSAENSEKITKLWNITNEILKKELTKNFREKDLLNPVYIMTFSGARGNISQIRQLIGMRGLMSDSKGEIINLPIKSNLKEGLKITEYFISCYGARKGLVDTALKTANSGYLTRRLIYVTQNQIIQQSNCGTKNGFAIKIKKGNAFFNSIKDKIVGKVLAKDIRNKSRKEVSASSGQDICKYLAKKIINSKDIGKIYVKSPLLCELNRGICQLCYGWNLGSGRMVELGETVGIIAAQSIGEPGTQLTMRTFHTGGVFAGEVEETITAPHEGIIHYDTRKDGKIIKTKHGEKAFLTLKEKTIKILKNKANTSIIKVPKNSIIFVKPKKKVSFRQIITEIEDYQKLKYKNIKDSTEIITKISGEIYFDKIISKKKKQAPKNNQNGLIWILSGNILTNSLIVNNLKNQQINKSNKQFQNNHHLILKKNTNKKLFQKKKIKLSKMNLNQTANFNKINENTKQGKEYRIYRKITKNKKVLISKYKAEIYFKLKREKLQIGQFLLENKSIQKEKQNKHNSQVIQIRKNTILIRKANNHLSYKDSKINIKNNDVIKKGSVIFQSLHEKQKTEDIVQGLPKVEQLLEGKTTSNLKDTPSWILKRIFNKISSKKDNKKAARKSIEKIQKILVKRIQSVYESQGVKIADKHMEIIVKQMTSKVIIRNPGESKIITGELIEINKIEKINDNIEQKAIYEPLLLGISKVSLSNQSFISEASFQETTRVLARSAIEGRIDWLYGLKENIVLGNLIPAGTGFKLLQ